MTDEIQPIAGEPTRWLVQSATRPDYAFIVDSDYADEGRRGWACGCEQWMVRGVECRHIRKVKQFLTTENAKDTEK